MENAFDEIKRRLMDSDMDRHEMHIALNIVKDVQAERQEDANV